MTESSANFEIDIEHLHALGVIDPNSPKSLDIFASGQLSSNERLYFSLWGNKLLSTASFDAKKKIFQEGEDISVAYFIVSGHLLSLKGEHIERLGAGSVLCLAEGLAGLTAPKTVVTVTPVQARIIPLHKVDHMVPNLPNVIRQIIRTTVKRTLAMKDLPKGVL
jgi:CRP-like cAMP-binding protein